MATVLVTPASAAGTTPNARFVLSSFGVYQGWQVAEHERVVADVTGDQKADIVGFGNGGVHVAIARGDGTFNTPQLVLREFGVDQGWRDAEHPRYVADVNGDRRGDIVGFGDDAVTVALARGDGTFESGRRVVTADLTAAQGWQAPSHPRMVVDVTGDQRADLVGFGSDGVHVATARDDGTFNPSKAVLNEFGADQGWQVASTPRYAVDVTGDQKADIVGFGNGGVTVATAVGDGTFNPARVTLSDFSTVQGWDVTLHPRALDDVNGDGRADIVGFGPDAVRVATSRGDGTFNPVQITLARFTVAQGWSVRQHPRFVEDVNGDRNADLIAFGDLGAFVALAAGDGTFQPERLAVNEFGVTQGWKIASHPRTVTDITGDGRGDIVGFGDAGVFVSVPQEDGTFE